MNQFLWIAVSCSSERIRDWPISFSEWRTQQTLEYVNRHYAARQQTLEMLPVMVVSHYTAIDSLEASYSYMNREEMESSRGQLKAAGGANIAVHYLVGKAGEIFRLMPENRIGRHVIGLNRHAIGIENVGLDENALTMAQVEANALIIRRLAKRYPLRYLIGHSEYRKFEKTPLWEEIDQTYRTEKHDPGEWFMSALRERLSDLPLRVDYDRSEIPDRIRFILQQAAARGEFSGVALVIDDGKIIFREAIGNNPETGKPLRIEDRFYLASAAKPLTALAIARLEAEQKLSFDSPVGPFFPELKALLAGVRVRHLLSHTSGLDDYYRYGLPAAGFSNEDALRLIAEQKRLLSRPGSKFRYANSNYLLLAELAQRIVGKPFVEWLAISVLTPAAMPNTVSIADILQSAIVPALDSNGRIFRYSYKAVGPGGLVSTADDLAALDLAFMDDRLLTRRQREKLLQPVMRAEKRPEFYAFGWYVLPGRQTASHDGNFNGYHTMNWMQLKKRQAIILLSNRYTARIRDITGEIDRALNGLEALDLR